MNKKLLIQCDCKRCSIYTAKLLQHSWNTEIKEDKENKEISNKEKN